MMIYKEIDEQNIILPIIASPGYFIANDAIDYGYFIENNNVLPFYIKKKLFFTYMIFTTGVIGTNNKYDEELFLNEVVKFIKNNKLVDFINIGPVTALFKVPPKDSISCNFGSYIIDLSKSESDLLNNLHKKHRNEIRRGIKDGIRISNNKINMDKCLDLINNTINENNLPELSRSYINKLSNNLNNNIEFWLAEYNGEPQSSAIILWSPQHTAYYFWGGSCSKPHIGSSKLLHWKIILKMKERGVKFYDFVGARLNIRNDNKIEGIQLFKKKFGSELKTGVLWKMPINNYSYKIYEYIKLTSKIIKGVDSKYDIIDSVNKGGYN